MLASNSNDLFLPWVESIQAYWHPGEGRCKVTQVEISMSLQFKVRTKSGWKSRMFMLEDFRMTRQDPLTDHLEQQNSLGELPSFAKASGNRQT